MIFGIRDGVVLYLHGCKVANKLFVLELIEAEAVASLGVVVVILHIRNHTFAHLELNIFCRSVLFAVTIHRVEILTYHRAVRNDVGAKIE